MSEQAVLSCQVGSEYRIIRLVTQNDQERNHLIACGLFPGVIIKVVHQLFRGAYWVIQVHGQKIGMRARELQQLKLYDVESD